MDDAPSTAVGGLFAAHVARRRAREAGSTVDEEGLGKKHKIRAATQLPQSSDDEEAGLASSSPARYRASSPHTELTVPSSTVRPCTASKFDPNNSPTRALSSNHNNKDAKAVENRTGVETWRKVHRVELSDEDEPRTISITPYQLYPQRASSPLSDGEQDYSLPTSVKSGMYAVDLLASPKSDAEDFSANGLAGLQLSPVRHAPSAKRERQQKDRLLNGIFDPTAASRKRRIPKTFNPEARFGTLQPSATHSDGEIDGHASEEGDGGAPPADDDDDDDWQQEVEEDFTFLDSEIELQDVA
uniref:Uncharacterized protein n=2 Tax=Kalmanozyma brasiliensis (strain GHG001) TaxID=1365824 RepID=V5ETT9_KALBG